MEFYKKATARCADHFAHRAKHPIALAMLITHVCKVRYASIVRACIAKNSFPTAQFVIQPTVFNVRTVLSQLMGIKNVSKRLNIVRSIYKMVVKVAKRDIGVRVRQMCVIHAL